MAEAVKSAYCGICDAQRKFTKETRDRSKSSKWMLKQGYKESNPLMLALYLPYALLRMIFQAIGGLFRLATGGSAYTCATCGSKMGAKAA